MNTNLKNKTFKDPVSLEVQDSRQIGSENGSNVSSAFMVKEKTNGNMPQSYGKISGRHVTHKESSKALSRPSKSNNNTPRLQVTVEFAAKQLFQILLVDIKRRNAKLNCEIVTCHLNLTG